MYVTWGQIGTKHRCGDHKQNQISDTLAFVSIFSSNGVYISWLNEVMELFSKTLDLAAMDYSPGPKE